MDPDLEVTENGEVSTEVEIPSRVLAETLAVIASMPSADTREAELIAIETLFDAHHPRIGRGILVFCILRHNIGQTWITEELLIKYYPINVIQNSCACI